jgi:hypothetical protein
MSSLNIDFLDGSLLKKHLDKFFLIGLSKWLQKRYKNKAEFHFWTF